MYVYIEYESESIIIIICVDKKSLVHSFQVRRWQSVIFGWNKKKVKRVCGRDGYSWLEIVQLSTSVLY